MKLTEYVEHKEDPLIPIVRTHQHYFKQLRILRNVFKVKHSKYETQ